jgi:hypothetical protein
VSRLLPTGKTLASCPKAAFGHCRRCRLPCTLPFLQPNRAGGVFTEQGALPDVPAKHGGALVARLLGDDALGDAGSSSRGRKAGRTEAGRANVFGRADDTDGLRTWKDNLQLVPLIMLINKCQRV